jgi:hypothetical protein
MDTVEAEAKSQDSLEQLRLEPRYVIWPLVRGKAFLSHRTRRRWCTMDAASTAIEPTVVVAPKVIVGSGRPSHTYRSVWDGIFG